MNGKLVAVAVVVTAALTSACGIPHAGVHTGTVTLGNGGVGLPTNVDVKLTVDRACTFALEEVATAAPFAFSPGQDPLVDRLVFPADNTPVDPAVPNANCAADIATFKWDGDPLLTPGGLIAGAGTFTASTGAVNLTLQTGGDAAIYTGALAKAAE